MKKCINNGKAMFVCETCGYRNEDRVKVLEHEAAHFSISVKDMCVYDILRHYVETIDDVLCEYPDDEVANRMRPVARKNLEAFEREHDM